MKLLANENFPYKSIYYLKEKGYDVLSIGMDNPSIKDSEIMAIAINEGRTIMTFDRDYGELFFVTIISLRMEWFIWGSTNMSPMGPGIIIEAIITNAEIDFTRALTVDKNGIRQRRY